MLKKKEKKKMIKRDREKTGAGFLKIKSRNLEEMKKQCR